MRKIYSLNTLRGGFYVRAFSSISYEDLDITVKLFTEEVGKNIEIKATVTVFNDIAFFDKRKLLLWLPHR